MLPIIEVNSMQYILDTETDLFPPKPKKKKGSTTQDESHMDIVLLYSVVGKTKQVTVDRN